MATIVFVAATDTRLAGQPEYAVLLSSAVLLAAAQKQCQCNHAISYSHIIWQLLYVAIFKYVWHPYNVCSEGTSKYAATCITRSNHILSHAQCLLHAIFVPLSFWDCASNRLIWSTVELFCLRFKAKSRSPHAPVSWTSLWDHWTHSFLADLMFIMGLQKHNVECSTSSGKWGFGGFPLSMRHGKSLYMFLCFITCCLLGL